MEILKMTKPLLVISLDRQVNLDYSEKKEIQLFWEEKKIECPYFFNGELFSVEVIKEMKSEMKIYLAKTNYAHYLYTKEVEKMDHPCISLAVGTILLSKDGYVMMGKTGEKTEKAGILQLVGGGVDKNDFIEGRLSIESAALREIKEELGENIGNSINQFDIKYLIKAKGLCGIALLGISQLTKDEIREMFGKSELEERNDEIQSIESFSLRELEEMEFDNDKTDEMLCSVFQLFREEIKNGKR